MYICYKHTLEYYSAFYKKHEILKSCHLTTWMKPFGISQKAKDNVGSYLYIESKKTNKLIETE